MNKQELIEALSKRLKDGEVRYPKWELEKIINPTLEVIIETLSHGEEIKLNKFGRFFIQHKKGSPYYNINTKKKEIASDKDIVHFTPHKGFRVQTADKPESGLNTEVKKE